MRSRSRFLIFVLLILAFLSSACTPDEIQQIEEILDPDIEPLSEVQKTLQSRDGHADVYYHSHFNNPNMKFDIDMPFDVSFSDVSAAPGTWTAQGINQDWVTQTMISFNGSGGTCTFTCTSILKFVASGQIDMGPNGECMIPMTFAFVPQGDYILDGDCPEEVMHAVDCTVYSTIMMDPTLYTFTGKKTEVTIMKTGEARLEAEIKNLVFPEGMKGTCTW